MLDWYDKPFLAQNDRPGDVNLPARLYWWKEETHDAA